MASDGSWANDLSSSSTKMIWHDLKEKLASQEELENSFNARDENLPRSFGGLYIFVSSSMPKPLLKNYFEQARIYGGVLVFKGLPNGSFQELIKLVMEFEDNKDGKNDNSASLQIDDEAFERFSINSVPTIVLSKESEYAPNQSSIITF